MVKVTVGIRTKFVFVSNGKLNFRFHLKKLFFQLQLIEAQGYPAGEYDVTTEDGFILALHRVEAPRNRKPPKDGMKRGPPVLVVHGLESSSVCWTTDLWNESLGKETKR